MAGSGELAYEVELLSAEVTLAFLDGGVAFADVCGLGFVDEGPEFSEGGEVFGVAVAVVGEGEVEGLFFKKGEGVGGEGRISGDGVFAEFGGGLLGVGEFIEL